MHIVKNKNSFLSLYLTVLLLISTSLSVLAQKSLEQDINDVMEQFNTVGLSVAVVKDNEIVYTQAFGYKDIEKKIPLASDDLFRIASISKSFSSTALMQLLEQGKVSLDDDVSDLVGFKVRNPRFPNIPITLRMLLSHTSSINDSQRYFSLDIINPSKSENWAKSYSNVKPGLEYNYCNLNYNMAGAIIERLTGVRFDRYVKNNILNPLNLYGGYFIDELDKARFAKLYKVNAETNKVSLSTGAYTTNPKIKNDYIIGYDAPVFSPTGGMKISAPDLAKYMMMHMNKGSYKGIRIISPESAEIMQSEIIQVSPLASYGLAIRIVEDMIDGVKLKGHTGSAYGLFSSMFFHPEKKYGFVVITNGSKRVKIGEFNSLLKPLNNVLYKHFIEQ